MVERRSLTEGLKTPVIDPEVEAKFVFGDKVRTANARSNESVGAFPQAGRSAGRVSLTTRVRADLAGQLKRISLERQLSGSQPNSLQDIFEAALDQWLEDQSEPT